MPPGPSCGDKKVDVANGEVCDDGINSGVPGSCTPDCHGFVPLASCGDAITQPPEQCDTGASNGALTSLCDAHCKLKCGNGYKDPGEGCDNGVNNGMYGTCKPDCTPAGYCGDGVKNGPELCDNGAQNQANGYGPGICTLQCGWAPFCGDGHLQGNEQCDGSPGCDSSCRTILPQ